MSKRLDKGNGQDPGTYPQDISGHDPDMTSGEAPETTRTAGRERVGQTRKRPPKAPPLPRRLYDLESIRIYLGIPIHTVREIIWRGDLPYVKIGRRQYVDLRDVDQFIEQSKTREK